MHDNKYFRLVLAFCIGCVILTTACSTYFNKSTMGDKRTMGTGLDDSTSQPRKKVKYCVEGADWWEIESGDIAQCDWSKVDWSKVDLCKVNEQKTFFCKAIEMNNIDLLNAFLAYIKHDPVKYPREKVIYLIAGCGSKIRDMNMKMPLLMRAVIKGYLDNLDIIKVLFETLRHYDLGACEAVFSLKFGSGYTIIHEAVEVSNFEVIKYLINKYIEIKEVQGLTYASALSSLVEVLSIRNNKNDTALDLAFLASYLLNGPNSLDILLYLVEYGDPCSQIELGDKSVLFDVIKSGNIDMFNIMIYTIIERLKKMNHYQHRETVDKIVNFADEHGRTLLYYAVLCEAAKGSNPHAVEYLMELGASATYFDNDKNKKGISPLFIAIVFGNLNMVQLLLDKKFAGNALLESNINNTGSAGLTPLNLAVSCRDKLTISAILSDLRRFLKWNQDVDPSILIGKVNAQIVEALLNAGANPLIPDNVGETPLHKAVKKGRSELVELLLNAGDNPLVKNLKGLTALGQAAKQIPLRSSLEYGNGDATRMFVLMLYKVIAERYQGDSLDLYMDIQAILKYGEHKHQRDLMKQLLACFLKKYGVPIRITSPSKSEIRLCDSDASSINPDKKRKWQNPCTYDRSSGKSQAT